MPEHKHLMGGRINLTTGKLEVGDTVYVFNKPAVVTEVLGKVRDNIDGQPTVAQGVMARTESGYDVYLTNLPDFSWNWS